MPPLVANATSATRRVTPLGNKLRAKSDKIVFQPGLVPGSFLRGTRMDIIAQFAGADWCEADGLVVHKTRRQHSPYGRMGRCPL
jgi:hypothetical protein